MPDSAEIDIGAPYTSHTTFRSTAKSNKKTYSSEQTTTEAVTAEQTSAEMTFGYPMK